MLNFSSNYTIKISQASLRTPNEYGGISTCFRFLDGKEVTQHVFPRILVNFRRIFKWLGNFPGVCGNFLGKLVFHLYN